MTSKIGYMCRQLRNAKKINSTWMENGNAYVRVRESDKSVIVDHPDDLYTSYPDFKFKFKVPKVKSKIS